MYILLDRDRGIANVNRNERLYERLLEEFCTEHGDDAKKICQAIETNDFETAQRVVHTLKGVSGTLGAERIRAIAIRADEALKRDQRPEESDLADLDSSLQRLVSMIQVQSTPGLAPGETDVSINHSAFARMRDMLEQMNPAAEELAASLAPALSRVDAEITGKFIAQVKDFEFEAALESLAHLELVVG